MSVSKFSVVLLTVATVALLVGFELCGLSSDAAAEAGRELRAPKIAVVNIEDVTNDFLRNSGQLDNLREKESQQRNLLGILSGEIQALKSQLEIYPEEDPQYIEAQKEIAIKSAELRVRGDALKLTSNREKARLTAEVYEKAVTAINAYAQERGLDMVFIKQDGTLRRMSMEEVSSNILVRGVIWSRRELDITEEIKARMK